MTRQPKVLLCDDQVVRRVIEGTSAAEVPLRIFLLLALNFIFAGYVQAAKPARPTAPSSLSASAASASQINLAWRDDSSNESGFIIQRGPSAGGPWSQIATTGANSTSYPNTGLGAGTAYYYRICAYNSRGSSTYSTPASATTQGGCSYSISPANNSFGASAGSGNVSVTAGAGCSWTAGSGATWLSITAGGSGSGNGSVSYSVTANTSTSSRSGTLTIAGYTYTVNQSGASPCSYSISSSSGSFGASAGSGNVSVTAGAGCSWTAGSSATWLSITAGGSGSGNGTVSYSVAANTGSSLRSGTLTIAGYTFTVNQSGAPCAYSVSVSPPNGSFSASGGNGSLSLTASSSTCPWSAATVYQWITITSGSSGSGNGTVSYSVGANSLSARSGTITLGGQTFTISQAAAAVDNSPTASLTAPTGGATLTGTATFTANATDDVGVDRVEFWCDGSLLLGTDTAAPYSVTYNTASIPNGSRTFTCKAYDTSGKSTTSAPISATVNNTTGGTSGQPDWVRRMDGSYRLLPAGVAADHANNVVSAGMFVDAAGSTSDLGGGAMPYAAGWTGFLVKYSAQNVFQWVKILGGQVASVAVDSRDNIIVTGNFSYTVDFGGTTLTSTSDPLGRGTPDIFVAKYSPSGSLSWVKKFGGNNNDAGCSVAVDGSDNIVVAANFTSPAVDFGAGPVISTGDSDMAVFKLSGATGALVWAKGFGSAAYDIPNSVAVDRSGDVVLTGKAGGTVSGFTGTGGMVIAKFLGASGSTAWAKTLGGDAGNGITTDPSTGNIFVTGANGGIFLTGYDPSGNLLWARTYGGPGYSARAVATDGAGRLAIVGKSGSVDFTGTGLFTSGNFLINFTVSGNSAPVFQWAKSAGINDATGVAFDSIGHVVAAGSMGGSSALSIDFGGVSTSVPMGVTDGFVVRYTK